MNRIRLLKREIGEALMCARLLYSVASRHCCGFFHPESLESAAGFWGEGKTLKNAFVVS